MPESINVVSKKILDAIRESYSADVLPRVRKPARWGGDEWTCVWSGGPGPAKAGAYRLVAAALFCGPTYDAKLRCSYDHEDDAPCAACIRRESPEGFYHGVCVKLRKQPYVLSGPIVHFTDELEPETKERMAEAISKAWGVEPGCEDCEHDQNCPVHESYAPGQFARRKAEAEAGYADEEETLACGNCFSGECAAPEVDCDACKEELEHPPVFKLTAKPVQLGLF